MEYRGFFDVPQPWENETGSRRTLLKNRTSRVDLRDWRSIGLPTAACFAPSGMIHPRAGGGGRSTSWHHQKTHGSHPTLWLGASCAGQNKPAEYKPGSSSEDKQGLVSRYRTASSVAYGNTRLRGEYQPRIFRSIGRHRERGHHDTMCRIIVSFKTRTLEKEGCNKNMFSDPIEA